MAAFGAEAAIHPRGWIAHSVRECHLMTSPEAGGGRESTSGQRHARASRDGSSTSLQVHTRNNNLGARKLLALNLSPLTSLGQVARNATRRGHLKGSGGEFLEKAARTLDPGQKTATFDRSGKRPHLLGPSPPPSYGPSSGPIGLCPSRGRTLSSLLSSRQLRR